MRGERRLAARAVGHHLVALVQESAIVDLGERPPHRLDVGLIECPVGVLEIQPETDPLSQPVPVLQEGEDRRAALGVEALDADLLLDLRLGGDAQLLFDRDLHRQAVAIPSALALHAVAAHRLKTRIDVLEGAREHVVGAGWAVGCGRSLVEDPLLEHLPACAATPRTRRAHASAPEPPARVPPAPGGDRPRGPGISGCRGEGVTVAAHCRWPGRRRSGCEPAADAHQ